MGTAGDKPVRRKRRSDAIYKDDRERARAKRARRAERERVAAIEAERDALFERLMADIKRRKAEARARPPEYPEPLPAEPDVIEAGYEEPRWTIAEALPDDQLAALETAEPEVEEPVQPLRRRPGLLTPAERDAIIRSGGGLPGWPRDLSNDYRDAR